MSFKLVFLFALAVIAIENASADIAEATSSDLATVNLVPDVLDGYMESLFAGTADEATLVTESPDSGVSFPRRFRRKACRTIKFRTKSGKVYSIKRC